MQVEINKAVEALRTGGVILFLTEIGWGLGADATNSEAVRRIIELTKRQAEGGLMILVEKDARIERHVQHVPELAWDLYELSNSPIALILPSGVGLADGVYNDDKSVAIRITSDKFCGSLIGKLNKPMAFASLSSAKNEPTQSIYDIDPEVLDGVDYTVNLPVSEHLNNPPLRIIKLGLDGTVKIIR